MIFPHGAMSRQLGRFVLVGSMGVGVDFVIYFLLTRGWAFWQVYFLWANVVAFFVANLHNYFWHRRWTFGIKGGEIIKDYAKFLSASLGYLVLIETGLVILTVYAEWPDLLAKVAATVVAVGVYFLVLRSYIFKPRVQTNQ